MLSIGQQNTNSIRKLLVLLDLAWHRVDTARFGHAQNENARVLRWLEKEFAADGASIPAVELAMYSWCSNLIEEEWIQVS